MRLLAELDTPEKIAFGILLAAVTGITGVITKGIIDRRQTKRNRKAEELTRCFREFEKAAATFLKLSASYYSYLKPPTDGTHDEIGKAALQKLMETTWDEIARMISTDVNQALHALNDVDASLHVAGAIEASILSEKYRHAATELQFAIVSPIDTRKAPTIQEWQGRGANLAFLRQQFCNQVRRDIDAL